MLDSRQRDELNGLIKYLSNRVAWFRIGLFVSSLIQLATNVSTKPESNQCIFYDRSNCAWGMFCGTTTFFYSTLSIVGDVYYVEVKSVLRRRLLSQMEVYCNICLALINFVVAWMLQTGWRSWPAGYDRDSVYQFYESNAHTIVVFTFFNAALLAGLFYLSLVAYNEGSYYLYHRVQQGVSNAFDTDPIIHEQSEADSLEDNTIPNPDFLPRPFSPEFGKLRLEEDLPY